MSRERIDNNRGITPENAKLLTGYVEDLIRRADDNEILLPRVEDSIAVRQRANDVYNQQVDEFNERSPGYEERLKKYRLLGRFIASAPHAHLFFRILDDYIDGDIKCDQDQIISFLEGVASGVAGLDPEDEKSEGIMPLYRSAHTDWGTSIENAEESRLLTLYGVLHMLEDPIRAETGEAVPREELNKFLLHNTGSYFSLLYMALGTNLRAFSPDPSKISDVAKRAAEYMALLQHLRPDDLSKDWEGGIKNIPLEPLQIAGLEAGSSYAEVAGHRIIKEWALEQAYEAEVVFLKLGARGLLYLPTRWKAAIVIPAVARSYWKIKDQVQGVYGS